MANARLSRGTADSGTQPRDEGALPRVHGNTKHGLFSKVPIIRALLPPDEAEAWDRAPVPSDCSEALEEIFREFYVQLYRVHKWEQGQEVPGDVEALQPRVRLLHLPLRGLLKSIEHHARLKEAERTSDMGDAVLTYLRTLPAHRLEELMIAGEAPRCDPTTGQPIPGSHPEIY